ncbi:hypothetical protein O0L34_g12384 [Tuta absoluta]|nr:hypothetical protein O0L34_g12384 [Tuta absoluta]
MAGEIVINEFLSFVQNKLDCLDVLSITQICVSNFTDEEVNSGKEVLYKLCGDGVRNVKRKGDDKRKNNIKDVIKLLQEIDPTAQPTFVAKDLNRLPPISFDYVDVTRLLKDMTAMRSELTVLKSILGTEITELKNSFDIYKAGKTSKSPLPQSKTVESSPLGPSLVPRATHNRSNDKFHTPTYRDIIIESNKTQRAKSNRAKRVIMIEKPVRPTLGHTAAGTSKQNPTENISLPPPNVDKLAVNDVPFTLVERKKSKRRLSNMRGTLEASGTIQVAETLISIYVSRTKKEVTVEDIQAHIRDLGESYVSVEKLKQNHETTFNSFKIIIPCSKLNVFLEAKFWPAVSFNCQGLKRSAEQVRNICSYADIIALQETWLLPHDLGLINNLSTDFAGYTKSAVDTSKGLLKGRPYGGVAILYRKALFPHVSVVDCEEDRLAAIKIELDGRSIVVFSAYLPWDCEDNLIDFTSCLASMSAIIEDSNVEAAYVLGDFNAHPGTRFGEELRSFCADHDLVCADHDFLPRETYTFTSAAHGVNKWLDHCVTTNAARSTITSARIAYGVYWSDHYPLVVTCNLKTIVGKTVTEKDASLLGVRSRIASLWSRIRSSDNEILRTLSECYDNPMFKHWLSVHRDQNKK